MNFFKRLVRIRFILSVCRKYRLAEFLPTAYRRWRILLILVAPFSRPCDKKLSEGERLRLALMTLGPIFIKFGQLLSTRRDLLPLEISDALAQLQDKVDPFCGNRAIEITETALKESIDSVFAEFDSTPLASASVAQVHTATLLSGEKVVVKVLRPGIRKVIESDLSLMTGMAQWLERHIPASHRFKPVEVVDDYQQTILNELDLRREAANTMELKRNWKDSKLLYVPDIYWDYCHREVLVMERIHGIPISDIEALKAAGTNMQTLSERGVEIFFTQVFRDSYFHADMHPGNIFVDITDPEQPRYIAIDCGIMGTLTQRDKRYLAENFLAFFNRDYRMIAKLHIESGWIPAGTSEAEFEGAIRTVCEPIFGKPLSEISFGHFLLNLFQTARQFDMAVQPQLVLLQKTLLYIEGLGRQLYPELDLWKTAKPYLEDWLKERMGPAALFEEVKRRAPFWREKLPEIPDLVYQALNTDIQQKQQLQEQIDLLQQQLKNQGKHNNKIIYAITGMASLITGVILEVGLQDTGLVDTLLIINGLGFLLAGLRNS